MDDARPEIACLGYHEVTDDPTTSGFQRAAARPYTLSRQAFSEHLDAIAACPRQPGLVTQIDLSQPGRHVLLTFDDGGRSAVEAAELLGERGWKGHFFIVTSRIGERTFLDAAALRSIRRCGHLIGSHSHTHPDIFRDETPVRMLDEWRTSAAILSSILGESCVAASVPGGDISSTVLRVGSEAGFRYLFTSEPWVHPRTLGGCWVIGRVCLKAGVRPEQVRDLVQLRGWTRALVERNLKEIARRGLGSLYGAYVRHVTRGSGPAQALGDARAAPK